MSELVLIVRMAGARVAFPAGDVESVVEIDSVTPVPRAAAHVAGLAALRSRVLTVIDAAASLKLQQGCDRARDAVVAVADGHAYALLVDAVEDVVEATGESAPLSAELDGGWSRVACGMIEAGGHLLLQVDVRALIAGPPAATVGIDALSL